MEDGASNLCDDALSDSRNNDISDDVPRVVHCIVL
jgi:hypothetical protein